MSWVTLAAARPLIRKIENGTSGLLARRSLADEGGEERRLRAASPPIVLGSAPADVGSADERVDQQQHPGRDEHRAGEVEAAPAAAARLAADQRERAECRRGARPAR